jgi:predicted transcriptional regulator
VTDGRISFTLKESSPKEQPMTLTIEVSGELEAALKAQAHEQGLTADRVARRVLARALTPGIEREEAGLSAGTSGKEKARAFAQWAKSHRDTPPLSDEAIGRASLNPDRW